TGPDLTGLTDVDGTTRAFAYDASHKLTRDQWQPLDAAFSYDAVTGTLSGLDRGLGSTYAVVPAALRPLHDPVWTVAGAARTLTDALGHEDDYQLDARGRPLRRRRPDGLTESWQRDGPGLVTQATDARGLKTSFFYDLSSLGKGELLEVDYPDDARESF